jgi:hypothetical protein
MAAPIAWGELAGSQLDAVVALEVYKLREPADFSKDALAAVLALNDKTSINNVLLLKKPDSEVLLMLPSENLKALAGRFSLAELQWLASYLRDMGELRSRNRLVLRLLQEPVVMAELQSEGVKKALISSADIDQTLDFIASGPGMLTFLGDATALASGEVPLLLFWHKYGTPRNVAIVLGVLALWIGIKFLRRIIKFRQRPTQVIVTVPRAKPHDEA